MQIRLREGKVSARADRPRAALTISPGDQVWQQNAAAVRINNRKLCPTERLHEMSCFSRYSKRSSAVRRPFICLVLVCLSAGLAAAQSPPVTFRAASVSSDALQPSRMLAQTPAGATPPANSLDGPLYLSLQQALQMALKNNLDIELEQIDQRIADLSVPLAQGGGLTRSINYAVADTPSGEAPAAAPLLSFSSPGLSPLNVDPAASTISSSYNTSRALEGS